MEKLKEVKEILEASFEKCKKILRKELEEKESASIGEILYPLIFLTYLETKEEEIKKFLASLINKKGGEKQ